MKKVIITRGLPSSGKSTWSKELIAKNPSQYKRINKDDLRSMLDGGKWSRDNEKMVLQVRDQLILLALEGGKHVIVDDTNLAPKHEVHIRELVKGKAEVVIQDFTDVPLEECIRRDSARPVSVGEKVIRDMWRQFLAPAPKIIEWNMDLPTAICIDVDGTLALFEGNPYERDFSQDKLNKPVAEVVSAFKDRGVSVIIISGRKNKFMSVTKEWLDKHNVRYDAIFMPRLDDDNRKDYVLKKEVYDNELKDKFNILFIIDDRKQVKRVWVQEGLFVFDVNQFDIEF